MGHLSELVWTFAVSFMWRRLILVIKVLEPLNWNKRLLSGYIFECCIPLVLSLLLLGGFAIQSLLAALLCWLASTQEKSSRKFSCAWHWLRTLHKFLGRGSREDYWFFLASSLCCSNCPTILLWTLVQSVSIQCKAAWLSGSKYLSPWKLVLIRGPIGLSTLDNNNRNEGELPKGTFPTCPHIHWKGFSS